MQYRPLGRTGLRVSAVGFGTAQLRRVSEVQAIDALLRAFDFGVNLVHVAPDYEGADVLVADAVARTSKKVVVTCNAFDVQGNSRGRARLFERSFETACRRLRTDRLELFGIASIEDREALRENVWGRHGMVEFLQRMKGRGRLGATFCTTHGCPDFTRRIVESGAFDAVMLAYNELGFHSLTLHPPPSWHFEDLRRTGEELLPLCHSRGVGVMVMLPLGGGLICRSRSSPSAQEGDVEGPKADAGDVLRGILARREVSSVVPGTCSPEEAEENARAGHLVASPSRPVERQVLEQRLRVLRSTTCSRCGECEPTCSQGLPISWLVRAAYMCLYSSSPYETWEEVEYFRLHPAGAATCETCPSVTCVCPSGLDVPRLLTDLHRRMVEQVRQGRVQAPPAERASAIGGRWFAARVVTRELPTALTSGLPHTSRLYVENAGYRRWHPPGHLHGSVVRLRVKVDGHVRATVPVRNKVVRGGRCHFVFELTAAARAAKIKVQLELVREHRFVPELGPLELFSGEIPVFPAGEDR
jgi:predicted aldo/keto reductase-like oxidoreductase